MMSFLIIAMQNSLAIEKNAHILLPTADYKAFRIYRQSARLYPIVLLDTQTRRDKQLLYAA